MTKPLLSFLCDNVSEFICFSNVTPYIVHFDVFYTKSSRYSSKTIVLKYTQFSIVVVLPQTPSFSRIYDYWDYFFLVFLQDIWLLRLFFSCLSPGYMAIGTIFCYLLSVCLTNGTIFFFFVVFLQHI